MSGGCEECGQPTVWDQDVGSAICTACGTLADPTQSVLTSHVEDESSARESLWNPVQGSTLKSRSGRALAGQGKEARDRNNMITMHAYIQSIARRLSNPGITMRAQAIFVQAMARGQYKWGRKAKLVAGASVAITLRESRRSDALRDIAYLLDETYNPLSRVFKAVIRLLELNLDYTEPTAHLPALQTHLATLTRESSSALPRKLINVLESLLPRLTTVSNTATSLSTLLSRTNTLSHLPTPPTACAILILALEGELMTSLPHAGALAQALGARVGAGKGVVMQRYKVIYDLIEEWIGELPWLEGHERKKGGTGRSKLAKRVVVARGLKDVVQFQEEIWRKKVQGGERLKLVLEAGSDDGAASESEDGTSTESSRVSRTDDVNSAPPRKKRKTVHERNIAQASQFLLDPAASSDARSISYARARDADKSVADLLGYILTADASSLSHTFAQPPSRLQQLAVARGGADEADIADEELFADGELEGLLRSADEIQVLRQAFNWEDDANTSLATAPVGMKKRKAGAAEEEDLLDLELLNEKASRSGRIDMDALARIMDPTSILDGTDYGSDDRGKTPTFASAGDSEVVEEPWRPLSPGGGGIDEDWYDF